jgi:hypothetical protein
MFASGRQVPDSILGGETFFGCSGVLCVNELLAAWQVTFSSARLACSEIVDSGDSRALRWGLKEECKG